MKSIQLIITSLLLLVISPNLYAISTNHPRAKEILTKIQKIPEVNRLIQDVEKEGPVHIEVMNITSSDFDAFWDSANRVVRINERHNQKEGVFICSLIFELHNASTDRHFKQLYQMAKQGQISKDKYVENVERMEHQNALNASTILEKGIRLGIFDTDARWFILRDFKDHFRVQKMHGHSAWIAKNYDRLRQQQSQPYKGSEYENLSAQDKKTLMRYMKIKDDLESPVDEQVRKGMTQLKEEYNKLEEINANDRDIALGLMNEVFEGIAAFKTIQRTSAQFNSTAQN